MPDQGPRRESHLTSWRVPRITNLLGSGAGRDPAFGDEGFDEADDTDRPGWDGPREPSQGAGRTTHGAPRGRPKGGDPHQDIGWTRNSSEFSFESPFKSGMPTEVSILEGLFLLASVTVKPELRPRTSQALHFTHPKSGSAISLTSLTCTCARFRVLGLCEHLIAAAMRRAGERSWLGFVERYWPALHTGSKARRTGPCQFEVTSFTQPGVTYHVDLVAPTCTCPARAAGQHIFCKHMCAALLSLAYDHTPPSQPARAPAAEAPGRRLRTAFAIFIGASSLALVLALVASLAFG